MTQDMKDTAAMFMLPEPGCQLILDPQANFTNWAPRLFKARGQELGVLHEEATEYQEELV